MKTKLSQSWMPSGNVLALAKGKGMPIKDWLYHLLPEFRLYWIDAKKKKDSWDATFWNHAKREWEKVDKRRLLHSQPVLDSKPETDDLSQPDHRKVVKSYTTSATEFVEPLSKEERNEQADKWLSQLKTGV